MGGDRLNVVVEETIFDLRESVTHRLRFVGELDGEAALELRDKLGDDVCLEVV